MEPYYRVFTPSLIISLVPIHLKKERARGCQHRESAPIWGQCGQVWWGLRWGMSTEAQALQRDINQTNAVCLWRPAGVFIAVLSFFFYWTKKSIVNPERKYHGMDCGLTWVQVCFRNFLRDDYNYPPITYYWTGLLILDHSYLVGNLTISKIAETKALEPLKSWHLYQQFSNSLISLRDMSGPRLGVLSNK